MARYNYAVRLGRNNTSGKVRHPVVLVSGFDPFESTSLWDIYQIAEKGNEDFYADRPELAQQLINDEYDIVVFDYVDSHEFIQRNARALLHLIDGLRSELVNNPQATQKTIPLVIGYSMGGLVTRYALAEREYTNPGGSTPPHYVERFVSYDSPQQGA